MRLNRYTKQKVAKKDMVKPSIFPSLWHRAVKIRVECGIDDENYQMTDNRKCVNWQNIFHKSIAMADYIAGFQG